MGPMTSGTRNPICIEGPEIGIGSRRFNHPLPAGTNPTSDSRNSPDKLRNSCKPLPRIEDRLGNGFRHMGHPIWVTVGRSADRS